MSDKIALSVLIPALTGICGLLVGAYVSHILTSRREREKAKREFNLKYLIDAWRDLNKGSRSDLAVAEKTAAMERAIEGIQLFGSVIQVQMAQKTALELAQIGSSNTTKLLNNLRASIRNELGLEMAPEGSFFFRMTPQVQKSKS